MELIFYNKAAEILEITIGTLAHAVSRGELTKAGLQGNRRLLIKEQVMLYKGVNPRTGKKKRISYNGLSEPEQALWHQYASDFNTPHIDNNELETAIERVLSKQKQSNRSQEVIAVLEAVEAMIRNEVPQGTFFREHPKLATIMQCLFVALSIAAALALYASLDTDDQKEVLAYLNLMDTTLALQECQPEPPVSLDEIRKKRKSIEAFKQEIKTA